MIILEPVRIAELIGYFLSFAQLGLIWFGLLQMKWGTERREEESKRQHEESMAALNTLIRQSDESIKALRALIRPKR